MMSGYRQSFSVVALILLATFVLQNCSDSDVSVTPSEPTSQASLCLSQNTWNPGPQCDTLMVSVTNCGNPTILNWTAGCDSSWLSLSPSGGNLPGEFFVVADTNRTDVIRTATVRVTTIGMTDSPGFLTVNQAATPPALCISVGQWDAPALGGESPAISVTNCGNQSSVDWSASKADDWLTLSAASGSTPGSFTVTADTNNTGESRIGQVSITSTALPGDVWSVGVVQPPLVRQVGGYYTSCCYAWDVYVSGDYAYVAAGPCGVLILRISDPSNPVLVGHYNSPGDARDIHVSGDYAYVAHMSGGFFTLDISDPTNPTLAGSLETPPWTDGVFVSGDYAYLTEGYQGVEIVDVSDPSDPTSAGRYDTPEFARGVHVVGDLAYIADDRTGLQIVKISDPSDATLVGTCDTPDAASGIYVSGSRAYIADYDGGLQIIDVADPSSPVVVGSHISDYSATDVHVFGNYAYLACQADGLFIIDISNPANPTLLATHDLLHYSWGVFVAGGHAFVADGYGDLAILEVNL